MGEGNLTISSIIQKQQEPQESKKKVVLQSKPQLEEGVNLLEKPENLPVFQKLVASELEGKDAEAVWIDTKNESSTYALSAHGGSQIMDKVKIGRAFTPFQHHQLIQDLEKSINKKTQVLMLPNITSLYASGQISDWEAEEMLRETWNKIQEIRKKYKLKILVSIGEKSSTLTSIVLEDIKTEISVEKTVEGLKYSSDDFSQAAYQEGSVAQTTFSFWNQKSSNKNKVKAKAV